MKKIIITLCAFLLPYSFFAQVPEGGIRLNAETGNTWEKIGNCSVTEESVEGQDFTIALRIDVGDGNANSWDAQMVFTPVEGIVSDDVVLVAFYARTISSEEETGEGKLNVVIENNSDYSKEIYHNISIGNEWKQYYASGVMNQTLSTSQVRYLFHCGFDNQVIEVADVQYLNYKQTLSLEDLPYTEITYSGQAADATWRAPAAERIEQHRKGVADITVYDESGNPLPGATVEIKMLQHDFGFGTAIAANEFNSNATYRNRVLEDFNEVVFENDMKWPQFNPSSTSHITKAMDTLDAHHIPVRGHNIIWPSWRWSPSYLENYKNDPLKLTNAIDKRFEEACSFAEDRLNDWDVMNEPYSEHDIMDVLGNEVMAHWYLKARELDRTVKLYINDYSIISAGGKNTTKQDYYYKLIQEIENDGATIDGIGFQGHMSTELTPITKVYDILERFAALGKEMKITEHDIDIEQRNVQAEYTRDFLTICFSHPMVKSVLVWGFWESRHWKPDAALYDADWTIRPHGQMWRDMIYDKWWTKDTIITADENGKISLEGFLGTYSYTLTSGDNSRSGEFHIEHSNASSESNAIMLSLDAAIPETVEISSTIEGYLCTGESTTLSVPEGEGLSYTWYKDDSEMSEHSSSITVSEAGSYKVEISKSALLFYSEAYSVYVHEAPSAIISETGEYNLCIGDELSVRATEVAGASYSWRKNGVQVDSDVTTFDIEKNGTYALHTSMNGCVTKSDDLVVNLLQASDPACSNVVFKNSNFNYRVYPNPSNEDFFVEKAGGFPEGTRIELYNSIGALQKAYSELASEEKIKIEVEETGVYIVRINDAQSSEEFRLVKY